MMQYFIEREGLVSGKTKIQALWWTLLNGFIPLKIQDFECAQQLVRYCQDALYFFEWAPSSNQEIYNSLQKKLLIYSILLHWCRKEKMGP